MLIEVLALLGGFAVLAWSADRFVDGAAGSARILGMPPLLIGIIVVGFGTSAPEMLVSALAALDNKPGIAIGNALGSNITNIALILGFTAMLAPLTMRTSILRRELPLLFVATALTLLFMWDLEIEQWEGLAMLAGLVGIMGYMAWMARRGGADPMTEAYEEDIPADMPLPRALLWLALGLAGLLLSSRAIVWAAVSIAESFGVSELVIGLTIIALGTSLPELAASIASSRKGEDDLAIGNIIGSNMFNLLGVIGLAAALAPTTVEPVVLLRDFALMVGLTVALIVLGHGLGTRGRLGRGSGALLLAVYIVYQLSLYMMV